MVQVTCSGVQRKRNFYEKVSAEVKSLAASDLAAFQQAGALTQYPT